jgi:zinc protease
VIRTAPLRDDDRLPRFPVEQWRLANGLRIVVQADPRWPLVASRMCYDAGSRWDPSSRSGLAHLCEHLAFYGPKSPSGRTFPERIESAGGSVQAVTTTDRLSFSAVFPRSELAAVLAVEAERMARPLEPQDIEALEIQRRVLVQELRERSQSRLRAVVLEQIHRLLFPESHPYSRPPAGEPDNICAVTPEDIQTFATSHFSPRNAVLVLVGGLSIPATAELVTNTFEALPAGPERDPQALFDGQLPQTVAPRRVPAAVSGTHAHVAWSVPGFGQQGWYLASLLVRGLTAGRSSPLARNLVDRAGVAQEVRGSLVTMRDASTLVFGAIAARGVESGRLEQGLLEATDRLLSSGFSETGLERARKKALSDHYALVQSFELRADLCASLACYLDAPGRLETEPQRYLNPDVDTVAAFASGLRHKPARATLSLIPRAEAA